MKEIDGTRRYSIIELFRSILYFSNSRCTEVDGSSQELLGQSLRAVGANRDELQSYRQGVNQKLAIATASYCDN